MHLIKLQEIDDKINRQLLRGEFGIEKESLRVDGKGRLAATGHPKGMPKGISRDFSEGQVEFISGVYDSLKEACEEICSLQSVVEKEILSRQDAEYMWTYSNPPLFFGEGSIRIAEFTGRKEDKTTYREYLAHKYGRVKMLFSGVHLNYSMPREFFRLLSRKVPGKSLKWLKSEWYVRLCDVLMSDSWLIVALTSASPVADRGFLEGLGVPRAEWGEYASFRNSQYGYWNLFSPNLCYQDFPSYVRSIEEYIKEGQISSIQELYYPIRLKPAGENSLANLKRHGVNHIELRMLDLNPMCCAGVARRDLIFIHLLIAYRTAGLLKDWESKNASLDADRLWIHKEAAGISFWETHPAHKERALGLLKDMRRFFSAYDELEAEIPEGYRIMEALAFEEGKIRLPKLRYANQIRERYQGGYIQARMQEIRGE